MNSLVGIVTKLSPLRSLGDTTYGRQVHNVTWFGKVAHRLGSR